jgi:hypothetical protein
MPDNHNACPERVSRRDLIRGSLVGIAASAGMILGVSAEAEARDKASKAMAHYKNTPNDGERCGRCLHYTFPLTCGVVAGSVSFHGWCRFYKPRN